MRRFIVLAVSMMLVLLFTSVSASASTTSIINSTPALTAPNDNASRPTLQAAALRDYALPRSGIGVGTIVDGVVAGGCECGESCPCEQCLCGPRRIPPNAHGRMILNI